MRGLDPKRYSNETNLVLYLGISTYIGGKLGRQDERGNMLRASFMEMCRSRTALLAKWEGLQS
jgi:hypothetical protein